MTASLPIKHKATRAEKPSRVRFVLKVIHAAPVVHYPVPLVRVAQLTG